MDDQCTRIARFLLFSLLDIKIKVTTDQLYTAVNNAFYGVNRRYLLFLVITLILGQKLGQECPNCYVKPLNGSISTFPKNRLDYRNLWSKYFVPSSHIVTQDRNLYCDTVNFR